jgi:hypothetical protein
MKYLSSLSFILLLFVSCNKSPNEATVEGDFGIYLTADNILPHDLKFMSLSEVKLQQEPLIGINDLVSYEKDKHIVNLSESGKTKINELNVPTYGISFVVCVGKESIYSGAFWVSFSSQSFDGVTIDLTSKPANALHIGLGYPSEYFFQGEDPRSDLRIMDALKRAGKLT